MIKSNYAKPIESLWPLVDDHKVVAVVANHGTCLEIMERITRRGVRKEYKPQAEVRAEFNRRKPGHGLAIVCNPFIFDGYCIAYGVDGEMIWSYFLSYLN